MEDEVGLTQHMSLHKKLMSEGLIVPNNVVGNNEWIEVFSDGRECEQGGRRDECSRALYQEE